MRANRIPIKQEEGEASPFELRRQKIYDWMAREGISMVMFEDFEGRRDPSIRWLSGQPSDALLFLWAGGKSLLVPWDANMAALYAQTDAVIPYAEFERQAVKALRAAALFFKVPPGSRIEISPSTSYTSFLKYLEEADDYDILCRIDCAHSETEQLRAVKDEAEQQIYRKAAEITNEITDLLEKNVRAGTLGSESDVALFIEGESRKRGCEGTGFETLAAGAERSFGIHAFPAYTAEPFAGPGLSILDYGLKYMGYTTDVTLTFVRDPSPAQEKMLTLTEKAYAKSLSLLKDGVSAREIALAADAVFSKARKSMPHSLGHGIGLEAHEAPALSSRTDNSWLLRAGMIFTLEPGLYDPRHGGCRLENDILLTPEGAEVLTNSRIVRL
ncbi:peptidase, M24 family [Treponema primitia ZAS-2]|uniref:Peptidase, M24 family n=1 Tax=Treponema primitia (strain ATCC BAA-887 / DSM 12427 / ZAS-2) TaxID=545694 RepID=F5YH97_TREPZ|nr:Xaa-Pro peptidase family protein [Treponema primitia]AEF85165.1 peptidase, M24 family [Treponema primitia ZAS-2]